ncbi:MAG: transposase domain-containing protein [Kribbellaceae bacterium]
MAGGRFAPGHIGELTRIVPFEMVDAALAETGAVQKRLRDLPSRVVVYLLLAAALFAECGYGQVWARMIAGLDGLDVAVPTPGALAQARRRVGVAPLRGLFDLLRGPAAGVSTGGVRWGVCCAASWWQRSTAPSSVAPTPRRTCAFTPAAAATRAAPAIP